MPHGVGVFLVDRFNFETVVCWCVCVVDPREVSGFLVDRFKFEMVVCLVGCVLVDRRRMGSFSSTVVHVCSISNSASWTVVGWVCSPWTVSNLKRWCASCGVCVCVVDLRGLSVFSVDRFKFETEVCLVGCLCVCRIFGSSVAKLISWHIINIMVKLSSWQN